MGERATVTLQQGIWIDQQQLTDAGLQAPLEIAVQPGEIRIRSAVQEPGSGENASTEPGEANERKEVWDVFRSLGRDAQPGRLNDPSTGHDRFLYGASQ